MCNFLKLFSGFVLAAHALDVLLLLGFFAILQDTADSLGSSAVLHSASCQQPDRGVDAPVRNRGKDDVFIEKN